MKYKVIYPFIENGKKYWSGDTYSNDDKKRIKALASTDNKICKVLIEKIDDTPKEKAEVETTKKVDGAPETSETKSEGKTK